MPWGADSPSPAEQVGAGEEDADTHDTEPDHIAREPPDVDVEGCTGAVSPAGAGAALSLAAAGLSLAAGRASSPTRVSSSAYGLSTFSPE